MNKFKVGDRVRIVGPADGRVGEVATVIRIEPMRVVGPNAPWRGQAAHGEIGCALDLKSRVTGLVGNVLYPPRFLEIVYDGNDKVSWSECAWQPKTIQAGM